MQGSAWYPKVGCLRRHLHAGDRRFDECDAKNVCASSYKCQQAELCALPNSVIADMTAQHFGVWLKANPTDAQTRAIMTQVRVVRRGL